MKIKDIKELISLDRAAEILKLSVAEMRELEQSWMTFV